MKTLIRNLRLESDDYLSLADDAALPDSGKVIVSLDRLSRDCDVLPATGLAIGVRLANTIDVAAVWQDISDRSLIALEFPGFPDGRAYSQARLISERYQFAGELRATGKAVVRDQIEFMLRCGFTSFELREGQDAAACLAAAHEFSLKYQQAADHVTPIFVQRRRSGQ